MTKLAILKKRIVRAYNNPKNWEYSRFKGYPAYADKEVIIFANYFELYDEVGFYDDPDKEPICIIGQDEGKKAKFQMER